MMKVFVRKLVVILLSLNAKIYLWRTQAKVIAITGSAGKTSCKEFLKQMLDNDFDVLAPPEGYNTEIGAPLAVFGVKVPKNINSIVSWAKLVFLTFIGAVIPKNHPQIIIIEMGADKPGDIKHLVKVFNPSIGIILTVLPVHLEEFKTVVGIFNEKAELARAIPEGGKLFLNWDDENVRKMAPLSAAEVIFFGANNKEGYAFSDLESDLNSMRFTLNGPNLENEKISVRLYGKQAVYSFVGAMSVAFSLGVSKQRLGDIIRGIKPFKGRMNVIEGIRGSIIIDDSYNANPRSMLESLSFLKEQKGRRIALLGNMNELGDYEKEGHEEVGRAAAESADILVTVGDAARDHLAREARKKGMKASAVKSFPTSEAAGIFLKAEIKSGDIILAKGSQNLVRMEHAVGIIMKDAKNKRDILVRQSDFWKNR